METKFVPPITRKHRSVLPHCYIYIYIYIDIRNVRGFWLPYRKILCAISMYLLLLVKVLVCFGSLYWHDLLLSVAPLCICEIGFIISSQVMLTTPAALYW